MRHFPLCWDWSLTTDGGNQECDFLSLPHCPNPFYFLIFLIRRGLKVEAKAPSHLTHLYDLPKCLHFVPSFLDSAAILVAPLKNQFCSSFTPTIFPYPLQLCFIALLAKPDCSLPLPPPQPLAHPLLPLPSFSHAPPPHQSLSAAALKQDKWIWISYNKTFRMESFVQVNSSQA